jgi:hypothetical protein
MPTSGFEVRGRIVRQRSARFASVRFEVDGRGQEFAMVRRRSPKFAGVAVTVASKRLDRRLHLDKGICSKLFGKANLMRWLARVPWRAQRVNRRLLPR